MIIQFLISLLFTTIISFFVLISSGGFIFILWDFSLIYIILSLLPLLIISGQLKDFLFAFSSKQKLQNAQLVQLKKTKNALIFVRKSLFFVSLFFACFSAVFFVYNYDIIEYTGPNLASLMLPLIYGLFFALLFIPLEKGLQRKIILFMAEEPTTEKTDLPNTNFNFVSVIKLALCILFFVSIFILFRFTNIANDKEISSPIDIYFILFMIGFLFINLICSGNAKNFFGAFASLFSAKKIDVNKQNLFINALNTAQKTLFYSGFFCTLIAFMAIMANLEDKSALVTSTYVALLPSFYGITTSFIIFVVKSKINKVLWKNQLLQSVA